MSRQVFAKLSSFGFSLFYLLPSYILHSMGLCLVSSYNILSTIYFFPFFTYVFMYVCTYVSVYIYIYIYIYIRMYV